MPQHSSLRRKNSLQLRSSMETKKKKKKKARPWLMWVKLGLSAAVPLAIAIFTVISYIQQNEISKQNRQQDQLIANATREKDLYIAERHRNEDAHRANLTRLQDADLANLTRQKDIDLANEQREEDRGAEDRQLQEDQRRADDLHYQTLYSNYIEDISNVLYKDQQTQTNQSIFSTPEKKMFYIRQKTLLTLRAVDSRRKSLVFIFLHDNNLLSETSSSNRPISLEGADLRNLRVSSLTNGRFFFHNLVFRSVDLTNATFVGCTFNGTTTVIGSLMTNSKFIYVNFTGSFSTHLTEAVHTSFINCTFKGTTSVTNSLLTYAKFLHSNFNGAFSAHSIEAMYASFIYCNFKKETKFKEALMSNSSFVGSELGGLLYPDSLVDRTSLDFVDFSHTILTKIRFDSVDLSYSNFNSASFRHVDFVSETRLMNSDWTNATVVGVFQIHFMNINLSEATFDHILSSKKTILSNVILPNGTWVIDSHINLVTNGDAERNCVSFNGTVADWNSTNGSPSLYNHMKANTSASSNVSLSAKCSFSGSSTGQAYSIQQIIDIHYFSLFLKSGELQAKLSVYFGCSGNKCRESSIQVSISAAVIYNEDIYSLNDSTIPWYQHSFSKLLPAASPLLQTMIIYFLPNTQSCLIDNIELHFERRS